jgi:tetratricopeptide (TPR) repeat protein
MKKIILFITILSLNFGSAYSQVKAGNKNFERLAYARAAANYERALKKDSSDASIWANLADCYRLTRNTQGAEKAYGYLVKNNKATGDHYLYYAEALMQNGKYNEAKSAIAQFQSNVPNDKRGKNIEDGIKNLDNLLAKSGSYQVKASTLILLNRTSLP